MDRMHHDAISRFQNGHVEDGFKAMTRLIRLYPVEPSLYSNLAAMLGEVQGWTDTVSIGEASIVLAGKSVTTISIFNMGGILSKSGNVAEASRYYAMVLKDKKSTKYHRSRSYLQLANGFHDAISGSLQASVSLYRRATEEDPEYAIAFYNLGNAYRGLKQYDNAISAYQNAVDLVEASGDGSGGLLGSVYHNMGVCFMEKSDYEGAIVALNAAQNASLPPEDKGNLMVNMFIAREHLCQWEGYDAAVRELKSEITRQARDSTLPSLDPFYSVALPIEVPTDLLMHIAQSYSQDIYGRVMSTVKGRRLTHLSMEKGTGLAIGYLSGELQGQHPTAATMRALLSTQKAESLDLTIVVYNNGPETDESPWRLEMVDILGADRMVTVRGLGPFEAAERINRDGITALMNVEGYEAGERMDVFALRPAPIQISFFGFPGSLGSSYIDYLVADPTITPPEYALNYSEKLALMPSSYQPNYHQSLFKGVAPLSDLDRQTIKDAHGLGHARRLLCNFGNLYKISPEVFNIWLDILRRTPEDVVLWLTMTSQSAEQNIRRYAKVHGVDSNRIVFAPPEKRAVHLERIGACDIFVDTFHCNAHTTASDALWTGIPVITLLGKRLASRVAASVNRAIGCPECITRGQDEYRNVILQLSSSEDGGKLDRLRAKLVENRESKPLFNLSRWASSFQRLLRAVTTSWENGYRSHISVS